tara:strand:- start:2099 stop:2569 length:471 start_codon:yes stop_codon:yes gene_type:complete
MLAELAAANAAFAVIKQVVQNGRDISQAAKAIGDFTNAKDALHVRGHQKKNSFLGQFRKGDGNDLEEFMALEQIKQKEEELKQFMIYCGRPGLWGDWVRFQVEARKRRQQEAIDAEKAREKLWEIIGIGFLSLICLVVLTFIGYLVLRGARERGLI